MFCRLVEQQQKNPERRKKEAEDSRKAQMSNNVVCKTHFNSSGNKTRRVEINLLSLSEVSVRGPELFINPQGAIPSDSQQTGRQEEKAQVVSCQGRLRVKGRSHGRNPLASAVNPAGPKNDPPRRFPAIFDPLESRPRSLRPRNTHRSAFDRWSFQSASKRRAFHNSFAFRSAFSQLRSFQLANFSLLELGKVFTKKKKN